MLFHNVSHGLRDDPVLRAGTCCRSMAQSNRGHKVALLCVEIEGRCEIDLDSVLRFGSRNFGLEITMGRECRHVADP